jgi:lipopolysaccharide export LptBFGC system permease protein LptF
VRRLPDRIRTLAARLFAEQTMTRVINPLLADLEWEYHEALARGGRWRAPVSLVRSYLALGRTVLSLALQTVRRDDSPAANVARAGAAAAVALVVVTAALTLPPILRSASWQADPGFAARLVVLLVPQALPLSIPACLSLAVLWAMRARVVSWRRVSAVLAVALAFTAIVWVVLEWMMPNANQAFRELVAARISNGRVLTLTPGLNELGLSRLAQRTDPAAVRQYQLLWALCLASVPLSILALGLARFVRRAGTAVALATILWLAYFAILWMSASTRALPSPAAAWIPNAVFFLAGSALLVRAQRPKAS